MQFNIIKNAGSLLLGGVLLLGSGCSKFLEERIRPIYNRKIFILFRNTQRQPLHPFMRTPGL